MPTVLAILTLIGVVAILVRLFLQGRETGATGGPELDPILREEFRQARAEAAEQARQLRSEIAESQSKANESLIRTIGALGDHQKALLEQLAQSTRTAAGDTRTEVEKLVQRTNTALEEIRVGTESRLDALRQALRQEAQNSQEIQDRRAAETLKAVQDLTASNRKELDLQRDRLQSALNDVVTALKGLEKAHQEEQQKAREGLDRKFQQIQESNEKKLEEMRRTVDEKLHETLEKRLGESFKLVSDRLEAVQRGLGEMQSLATDVGGLKRVLTNVKERGTWGEYQLGAILDQILTPEQFGRNVHVKDDSEVVEFAVRLPGRDAGQGTPVWLPIDSKFPKEDYERLVAAAGLADKDGVEQAIGGLLSRVESMARDIQRKYIAPPSTTDFGILFLPTEGLYAEVLRQPGFHDSLQQKYRVLVAGPTTLSAILNSLRVGFQTLAIEKRAHEVWTVLGAVKTEFGKFGEVLDRVKRQLATASNTIDQTAVRTRAMERRLRAVEQLPGTDAAAVLELPPGGSSDAGDEEEPGRVEG